MIQFAETLCQEQNEFAVVQPYIFDMFRSVGMIFQYHDVLAHVILIEVVRNGVCVFGGTMVTRQDHYQHIFLFKVKIEYRLIQRGIVCGAGHLHELHFVLQHGLASKRAGW